HWRGPMLLELGILHADRGDLEQAAEVLADAIAVCEQGDNPACLLRASYAYGVLRESQGALREAARAYTSALEYARERRCLNSPSAALIFAGLGRISHQQNELADALSHLQQALARTGSHLAGMQASYALVCSYEMLRVQTALGHRAEAEALFGQLA